MASINTFESPLDDDDEDDATAVVVVAGRISQAATSTCLGCIEGSSASVTDSNACTHARRSETQPPRDLLPLDELPCSSARNRRCHRATSGNPAPAVELICSHSVVNTWSRKEMGRVG